MAIIRVISFISVDSSHAVVTFLFLLNVIIMNNKMSTKNNNTVDARAELAELVKRKAEIAVSIT